MFKVGDLVGVVRVPEDDLEMPLYGHEEFIGSFGVVTETSYHWGGKGEPDSIVSIHFSHLDQARWVDSAAVRHLYGGR